MRRGAPRYDTTDVFLLDHARPALVESVMPLGDVGDWAGAIEFFLLALRAAGRPETTVYLRGYQLRRLAAAVEPWGPWDVSGAWLVAWLGSQSWSVETRRSWRSAGRV